MKIIVLEHPRMVSEKRFNDIANTPLWSCLMGGYAAASLEQAGFDTLFMDDAIPGATFAHTKEKLMALSPDLLCVNTVYFWEHTIHLFDFFKNLKAQGFDGHINLFGFFPTLVYQKIMKASLAVDSIAIGEFERTLVELATAIEKNHTLLDIKGLAVSSGRETVRVNPRVPENNPDRFAFPKRTSLSGTVTVLASRGCYNHCSFCPVPSFYNQKSLWQGRSPENVALEIKTLVTQGVSEFYFADPNFIGPGKAGKRRTLALLELIKPLNITFGMETRPNDLNDEILEKLVETGFKSLLMGIESGSGAVLKQIKKSSAASAGAAAIQLCRNYGIEPEIGFLMFVPDSRIADLHANMAFLQQNDLLDRLERTANLLCHSQIVLSGTSGYALFKGQNRLINTGLFDFEAEVLFSDPKVEWMSQLVIFACHTILKSMAVKTSPVFWEKTPTPVFHQANKYLVDLFFRLLSAVEHNCAQDDIVENKKIIAREINAILQ